LNVDAKPEFHRENTTSSNNKNLSAAECNTSFNLNEIDDPPCFNFTYFGFADLSSAYDATISTCSKFQEYSVISGIDQNFIYSFSGVENLSGNLAYVTVRSGSASGPIVGSGQSPLEVLALSDANLYVHWNTDSDCGTNDACATTTVSSYPSIIICCEGIPGALPGTVCDDGNPNTVNDVWTENCECEGEPPSEGSICATAIPITCNADSIMFSSAGSNGTNTTSCSLGSKGLWFSFTGTGSAITISSTANFNHEMSINSGFCDSLINIGCEDQESSNTEEIFTLTSTVLDETYYVYIAKNSSGSSTTGNITIAIDCEGIFDCQDIEANFGDSCNDSDESTENDQITESCECLGTPLPVILECGSEDFSNSNLTAAFSNGSFIGNDDVTWSYVYGRDLSNIVQLSDPTVMLTAGRSLSSDTLEMENKAIMLGSMLSNSKVVSSSISGGIGSFSAKLRKGLSSSGMRRAELFVNGVSQGLSIPFYNGIEYMFEVNDINIGGDVIIEIRNAASKPIIVDDMAWTCPFLDCVELEANIGDSCSDNNENTVNDSINDMCECVGEAPIEIDGCINQNQFGFALVNVADTVIISTCSTFEEYSAVYFMQIGFEYQFASYENVSGNPAFITVRSGSANGPVVGEGYSPLNVVAGSSYSHYVHWNTDSVCGTSSNCATSTAICLTCIMWNGIDENIKATSVLTSLPNPTSGPSQVVFTTAETGRTLVEVYDMSGRNVATLFNQEAQQGEEYRLDFNGTALPNGVYVYRLTTQNETIVEKFMIAR